jgi:hypothetical protein
MRKAGIITIIVGLILTIVTAITYFTKEKVVDIGKIEVTSNKRHHLTWSPLIGIAVMALGGGVFWVSYKKK